MLAARAGGLEAWGRSRPVRGLRRAGAHIAVLVVCSLEVGKCPLQRGTPAEDHRRRERSRPSGLVVLLFMGPVSR
jgi:hypothetical protein